MFEKLNEIEENYIKNEELLCDPAVLSDPGRLKDLTKKQKQLEELVETLSRMDGITVNGAHCAPHILSISIPGVPTQNSINILQDAGICVSAGSACAKGHRSHVLTAMGLSPHVIDSSFRISLSRDTTKEEVGALINGIQHILDWKNR